MLSCRTEEQVLFFCDPVSWETYSRRGLDEQALEIIAGGQGRRLEIYRTLPGAQAEEELDSLLQDRRVKSVFVTPFFTFELSLLAARFPEVLFVREQPPPPGQQPASQADPGNLVRIAYDREQAYSKAGEAAARLIAGPGRTDLISSPDARVGILTVPLSERGHREMAAFRTGFATQAEADTLVERRVDPPTDRVQARRVLEEMRQAGVELILFKTYSLTTFCLAELKKTGGWAIIEDYEGSGRYEGVVLLSIEDDLAGAFEQSVSPNVSPPALQGKSYLRWGSPEVAMRLRKELDFVRE